MTRRRGLLMVELLIAMLVFMVGLLALTLSLTFGVRLIKESGETTASAQSVTNSLETHMMDRILKGSSAATPSGDSVTAMPDRSITINGKTISLKCYRYRLGQKRATPLYIVERQ
ncbi:MAG: hypothetical protein Q4F74_07915 [Synergistaceae bacterium]|nr:hypothetical protein [Synergistaceae bacterium]